MPQGNLGKAITDCKAYRKLLRDSGLPQKYQLKGYMIDKETIMRILGQNNNGIDGIRIYVGLDEAGDVKPYAVGCVKEGDKYNDWRVPKGGSGSGGGTSATSTGGGGGETTMTGLSVSGDIEVGEPRPCPNECGVDNDLNTGG